MNTTYPQHFITAKLLRLSQKERATLWVGAALIVIAVLAPPLKHSGYSHPFADGRTLWGVPNALDVLSNVAFVVWGVVGLLGLLAVGRAQTSPLRHLVSPLRSVAFLFFSGLMITGAASAYYHLTPNNDGLAIDRLGMVVAFAGMLGLAAAERVSVRAGMICALATMVFGVLSVAVWAGTGNVLPWGVVQFGGMAGVVALAFAAPVSQMMSSSVSRSVPQETTRSTPPPIAPSSTPPIAWGWVIAIYALAKACELADSQIYAFSQQLISGHSLKHLIAACAAAPVVWALCLHSSSALEA